MISVVVPLYNEEENVHELYGQLVRAFEGVQQKWELVLVDDGSTDGSIGIIRALSAKDSRVKGLRHSRNFGQYAAVSAGLAYAKGDAVIIMDADLQEPPSLIPRLVEEWKSGYKAVYTTAVKRQDSFVRRFAGRVFYGIFGPASFLGDVQNISEMRLLDREVVDAFRRLKEQPRFIKGLFFWLGYKHTFVEYEKQERSAGISKYSYSRLARLAVDGLFSFSFFPILLIAYLGFIVFIASIVWGLAMLIAWWFVTVAVPAHALLVFVILFLGGIQLLSLGIIGEYIGRIYDEVRQRPASIVEEYVNVVADPSAHLHA